MWVERDNVLAVEAVQLVGDIHPSVALLARTPWGWSRSTTSMCGVPPHPVCQSRCRNPRASPTRTPVSANNIHSNLLRTDPRHCRASVS